jgi:hypothetical protein
MVTILDVLIPTMLFIAFALILLIMAPYLRKRNLSHLSIILVVLPFIFSVPFLYRIASYYYSQGSSFISLSLTNNEAYSTTFLLDPVSIYN